MEKIVSRFKGKLVKMIKNAGSKYDDYSISRESYKKLSQKKNKTKEYQRKEYQELVQYRKEALKNKYFFYFSFFSF